VSLRIAALVSTVIKTAAVIALALSCARPASAHEIPTDVVIRAIVKPQDQHLDLLVRVPLEAMRDVNFPETRDGYLQISAADERIRDAATLWIGQEARLYEDGKRLDDWDVEAVRLSLPSDRSFDGYDTAYRHVMSPRLADDEQLRREQALLDVLIRYPVQSANAEFSIEPGFARLGLKTTTVLRFVPAGGAERLFEFAGDPGLLRLDPSWHYAFFRFVGEGITHILDGVDHLLFVICLLIPFRRIRPLIAIVTAFTVAHSITLFASAFGMVPNFLWFPPLIETLIAASIVYMAFENIVGSQWQKRWVIAFGFGLVHGFGFSFALSEILQFAGSHLLTSLFAFNLGVEIGQLFIVVLAVPVLNYVFSNVVSERTGTILLSALIAHTGWHWMSERASQLAAYSFEWPALDHALFASLIRWLMLLIVIGFVVWTMAQVYARFLNGRADAELSQSGDTG